MTALRFTACFWLLLAFSPCSYGGTASVTALMERSGLAEQVQRIPASVRAGLVHAQRLGDPLPEATFDAMISSARRTIVAHDILAAVEQSLAQALSESEIETLLAWYQSDLGREIIAAEKRVASEQAQAEMFATAPSLYRDQQRVAFARQLDNLFQASDMVIGLQAYTGTAVFSALTLGETPNHEVDIQAVQQQILKEIEASRPLVEQGIVLSFLYAYQNLDMAKLEKYQSFLERPATRRFNDTVADSLNQALQAGITDFARHLAKLLSGDLRRS
ncbi:DUF2059 domain-containing protein [Marinobacter xestospongiae]|uniref:DUF2059 domain-containing protein n=1 Tax=Marinobacter xestospongiae TaxID=994319 RepID=UPI002003941E|nr:DUF2059 domain-containing protein [Marinobacter xestospongiae]MCK7568591.1 DUF2059 domain-containing protein [Marinobacter xestospongiae]